MFQNTTFNPEGLVYPLMDESNELGRNNLGDVNLRYMEQSIK